MRKKNFKGRCEKRVLGKCAEVCRTYDAIQYAYAHVLTDHKRESMALMEDLYALDQTPLQDVSYSVIVTTQPDGSMQFDVPDFPEVKYSGMDMPQALQYIKERLQEEKLISIFPPAPTPSNQIVLQPGQFLLQIPV